MKFVHHVTYTSDTEKILANRPKHREYLAKLLDQGSIVASGPYADDSGTQKSELKPWKLVFANPALLKSDA